MRFFFKKQVVVCLSLVIMLAFTIALNVSNFQYSTSPGNITFNGSSNMTMNLTIDRYVNVTSATMNLSGFYSDTFPFLRSKSFYANNGSSGIAFDGTNYYTSDYANDRVVKHNADWTYLSSFETRYKILGDDGPSHQIMGVTYLGGNFYTVEMSRGTFIGKYNSAGTFISYTKIDSSYEFSNADITHNGTHLFISSPTNDKINVYDTSLVSIVNITVPSDIMEHGFTRCPDDTYITRAYPYPNTYFLRFNNTFSLINNVSITSSSFLGGGLYCNETEIMFLGDTNGGVDQLRTYSNKIAISNPYISLNNTQIWNITGIFNTSNNKTDFSNTLKSAFNNGNCDCSNCFISGNNCSIPLIFHSDTSGIIQYSDISINYDPIPHVTLTSPLNASYGSLYQNFTCNVTDEIQITNISLNIWNSTGLFYSEDSNRTGTSNSTLFENINMTRTDTYYWNCLAYNNGSYSNWNENNNTLIIDIDNPVINLNYPTNGLYINNGTRLLLNYTPVHSTQTIDTCSLYSNFSGSWLLNSSDHSITNSAINSFEVNLEDGYYSFGVWCNTSESGNDGESYNYTFTIDSIKPIMNNLTIITAESSNQINFTTNITDINLETCIYSIWTGTTPGTNTTFTCNEYTLATAPGFGTYILHVWASDLANNINTQNLSFTTTITAVITGGGGGSTLVPDELTFGKPESICAEFKTIFGEALVVARTQDKIVDQLKTIWVAFWDYVLCSSTASIYPI